MAWNGLPRLCVSPSRSLCLHALCHCSAYDGCILGILPKGSDKNEENKCLLGYFPLILRTGRGLSWGVRCRSHGEKSRRPWQMSEGTSGQQQVHCADSVSPHFRYHGSHKVHLFLVDRQWGQQKPRISSEPLPQGSGKWSRLDGVSSALQLRDPSKHPTLHLYSKVM